MKLKNLSRDLEPATVIRGLQIRANGEETETERMVAEEHFLDVYVNEVLTLKIVCTPDFLPELVLGRLYTEGIIHGLDDVELLHICEHGLRARVYLNRGASAGSRDTDSVERTPTCCTGNRILTDVFHHPEPPAPVVPVPLQPEWIYRLSEAFEQTAPLYQKTRSVHSCFLGLRGEILYCCEDLGRHNAVDKVIGCALRDRVDLRQCILFSSGRLPTDMVSKAVRAGVPVLASKTAATGAAVELARQFHLTLVLFARPDHFTLLPGQEDAKDGNEATARNEEVDL